MNIEDDTSIPTPVAFNTLADGAGFEFGGDYYAKKNSSTAVNLVTLADTSFSTQTVNPRTMTVHVSL